MNSLVWVVSLIGGLSILALLAAMVFDNVIKRKHRREAQYRAKAVLYDDDHPLGIGGRT